MNKTNPPHCSSTRPRRRASPPPLFPGRPPVRPPSRAASPCREPRRWRPCPTAPSSRSASRARAPTARAALAANAAEMRRVIAALKAAGGDRREDAVRLALAPLQRAERGAGLRRPEHASRRRSRSSRGPGAVIDAAVNAGANQVYGPSLSRGDQGELYRQALKAAVANARANAQALAEAASLSLGRVTAVVEGGGAPQPMPVRRGRQGDGRRLDADRGRDAADHRDRHGHVLGRLTDPDVPDCPRTLVAEPRRPPQVKGGGWGWHRPTWEADRCVRGRDRATRRPGLRGGARGLEQHDRPPAGADRASGGHRRRRRCAPLRPRAGARRRRSLRRPQHPRLLDLRRRHRDRPLAPARGRRRSWGAPPACAAARCSPSSTTPRRRTARLPGRRRLPHGVAGLTLGGGMGRLQRSSG